MAHHTRQHPIRQTANTKNRRWDDWVPQERLRKLTEENKELAANLKKDMEAQRRAATGKPSSMSQKKRAYGSDMTGSSARGSEDRSSAVPQGPRGHKRGREIEGIDKVGFLPTVVHVLLWLLVSDILVDVEVVSVAQGESANAIHGHMANVDGLIGRGFRAQTCSAVIHPRRTQIDTRRRLGEGDERAKASGGPFADTCYAVPQ